jgi:DNA repair protein RadC
MENKIIESQWQVSEIQLSYWTTIKPSQRPKITSAQEAANILDEDEIELIEEFKILLSIEPTKCLDFLIFPLYPVLKVDARLVFVTALKAGAIGSSFRTTVPPLGI